MSESALVASIMDEVGKLRRSGLQIKALKIHGNQYQEAGTPDLHVTLDGRSYWIECKVGDNQTTQLQDQRILEWRSAGATACVVRSLAAFRQALGIG